MRRILLGFVALLVVIGCGTQEPAPKITKGPGTPSQPGTPPETPAEPMAAGAVKGEASRGDPAAAYKAVAAAPGALKFSNDTSKIDWVGTKNGGKHTGGFKKFSGAVDLPGGKLDNARVAVEIDTTSIDSDNSKLTNHLKSVDFFKVADHPTATFATTGMQAATGGDATHLVTGDLELLGVKKSLTFPAKVALSDKEFTLDASFKFLRSDFDMKYSLDKVHDPVSLTVSVKAPRK